MLAGWFDCCPEAPVQGHVATDYQLLVILKGKVTISDTCLSGPLRRYQSMLAVCPGSHPPVGLAARTQEGGILRLLWVLVSPQGPVCQG